MYSKEITMHAIPHLKFLYVKHLADILSIPIKEPSQ